MDYSTFLDSKRRDWPGCGRAVPEGQLPPRLHPFQRRLVSWALRKGRAALFADTGLGKTLMQLAWASQVPGRTLILAPLCVNSQTVTEARTIRLVVGALGSGCRLEITNYEQLAHVDPSQYTGVVLDESSILKAFDGKTRTRLIAAFRGTPYRLCCTATPAPNDIAELANHCEFLGIMSRPEMLATFFVHDEDGWRLRGHATDAFYSWLASWGMFLRRPSDIGFDDAGYALPPLEIRDVVVGGLMKPAGGFLFPGMALGGIGGRSAVRKASLDDRVAATADLIRQRPGPWLAWCGLNDEQDALAAALDGESLVSIQGSDTTAAKEDGLRAFVAGRTRILLTKPKIAGFGMNFQHCAQMAFVGLGDSYETYYQSIRRCYRYGQTKPVDAFVVVSETERPIVANVRRKEREAQTVASALIAHMARLEQVELGVTQRERTDYMPTVPMEVPAWMS